MKRRKPESVQFISAMLPIVIEVQQVRRDPYGDLVAVTVASVTPPRRRAEPEAKPRKRGKAKR